MIHIYGLAPQKGSAVDKFCSGRTNTLTTRAHMRPKYLSAVSKDESGVGGLCYSCGSRGHDMVVARNEGSKYVLTMKVVDMIWLWGGLQSEDESISKVI